MLWRRQVSRENERRRVSGHSLASNIVEEDLKSGLIERNERNKRRSMGMALLGRPPFISVDEDP